MRRAQSFSKAVRYGICVPVAMYFALPSLWLGFVGMGGSLPYEVAHSRGYKGLDSIITIIIAALIVIVIGSGFV